VNPAPEDLVTTVWDAIALPPTAHFPNDKQPEVRLVSWGVGYDIPGRNFDELTTEQREAVIAAHPRPGFKEGVPRSRRPATRVRTSARSSAAPASPPDVSKTPVVCDVLLRPPSGGANRRREVPDDRRPDRRPDGGPVDPPPYPRAKRERAPRPRRATARALQAVAARLAPALAREPRLS